MSAKPKADSTRPATPVRWVSRAAGGAEVEDRLAALMRAAEPARELSEASRARVWRQLRKTSRSWRPTDPILDLRWAVAVAVLLTSGVVIGAMSARRWWPERAAGMPARGPAEAQAAHAGRQHHIARPGEPVELPEPIAVQGAPRLDDPARPPIAAHQAPAIADPPPGPSIALRPPASTPRFHGSGGRRGARARELAQAAALRPSAQLFQLARAKPILQ
jgi:hypothetical protein